MVAGVSASNLKIRKLHDGVTVRRSSYVRRGIDGLPIKKAPAKNATTQASHKVTPKSALRSQRCAQSSTRPSGRCMEFTSEQTTRRTPTAKRRATVSTYKQQRSSVMMRQTVRRPAVAEKRRKTRSKKQRFMAATLPAMAVILFVFGLAVSVNGWRTNQKVAAQATKAVAAANTSEPNKDGTASEGTPPSTTPPSSHAVANYNVSPDMPRYFKMSQYGINARVLPMGVDKSGAIQTPGNVHDVGWYNASSKPGEGGAVLLDAHVSSWTAKGVFYHLKDLKAGDTVQVERGDGQLFTYKVVKTEVYDRDKVDMTAALLPITKGKGGLNMITCTGKVIPGTNEFDKRLVVFAEQV